MTIETNSSSAHKIWSLLTSAERRSAVLLLGLMFIGMVLAEQAYAQFRSMGMVTSLGVIINTSSLAGLEGSAGLIAYGTAKAAVAGMTLIAARDLSPVAIRVMAIAPSNIGEPEMDELVAGIPAYARVLEQTPWPTRIGRPEEYAMTVEFILANQYVNGSVIRLDGGVRLPLK